MLVGPDELPNSPYPYLSGHGCDLANSVEVHNIEQKNAILLGTRSTWRGRVFR